MYQDSSQRNKQGTFKKSLNLLNESIWIPTGKIAQTTFFKCSWFVTKKLISTSYFFLFFFVIFLFFSSFFYFFLFFFVILLLFFSSFFSCLIHTLLHFCWYLLVTIHLFDGYPCVVLLLRPSYARPISQQVKTPRNATQKACVWTASAGMYGMDPWIANQALYWILKLLWGNVQFSFTFTCTSFILVIEYLHNSLFY